jgi:hypothetical protein
MPDDAGSLPGPMAGPCIEVWGLEQARLVLAIAAGRPVTLLSMRGAARLMGSPWWRVLIGALDRPVPHILDCDDAAGRAAGALRAGQPAIVFDRTAPQFPAIAALADVCGAYVFPERPSSFAVGLPPYKDYRCRQISAYLDTGPACPCPTASST